MAKIMKENEEKRITLELYRKGEEYGIHIGSDGGSGITVEENTPMAVAQGIVAYIADLFYNEDDEDEEEEDEEDCGEDLTEEQWLPFFLGQYFAQKCKQVIEKENNK